VIGPRKMLILSGSTPLYVLLLRGSGTPRYRPSSGCPSGGSSSISATMPDRFEQESVEAVAGLVDGVPLEPRLRAMLDAGRLHKPMFTLRGGTNEVLRGIVARGMGLR